MRVSFLHHGGPEMASYRYRAQMPAQALGASLNDPSADVVVLAKPAPEDVSMARTVLDDGRAVIVDLCDDHLDWPCYRTLLDLATAVTCSTPELARRIAATCAREATVIGDPYEQPEVPPHGAGRRVLWFGHASNLASLRRVMGELQGVELLVVTNAPGYRAWSPGAMQEAWAWADLVILPATAPYKSANRAIESIRQGCFVVAEPHPAIMDIPGIWIGNIREGLEWAVSNWPEANQRTRRAQEYVQARYAPATQASAWKRLLQTVSAPLTLAAGR